MKLEQQNRVALVTGGSKGIGLECARVLADEGVRVAICSRTQSDIDGTCAAVPGIAGFATDLTDARAALRMLDDVERRLGAIDILVNSAGAARRTPFGELTPEHWRAAMDAKFFTYVNVMDPLVKRMAARGRGVIVNIIGMGGKVAMPIHLAGGAANAALMLATAGLGAAYAGKGVRVVGINPGLTETGRVVEGMEAAARQHGITVAEARRRSIAGLPMGRMAQPQEIANLVAYLASDKAASITGTTISMDGGCYPYVV